MFEKLELIEKRYDELTNLTAQADVIADMDKWTKLMKEQSSLSELVEKYRQWKSAKERETEALEIIETETDKEFVEMAKSELNESRTEQEKLSEELKILMLPKDENDSKNVIIEIRGGAGGDEAALFGADLMRMYMMYAESKGYKTEMLSENLTDIGGVKEASFEVKGDGAYSRLKYESGVHRVQRIPSTESGGRIHTSTVTVAVLPEAEDVEVEILDEDLRIDTYRASGAGGQHVNKTESAIRITHIPTGVVVSCQDEKSQHKNKDKAMKILRSRIFEMELRKAQDEIAADRRSQVGTGDRSERIRTYNFPQGRVTDHRIGLTLHRLEAVLNGDLDEIIDALISEEQSKKLSAEGLS